MRRVVKVVLTASVDLASVKIMDSFKYLIFYVALNYPFKVIISALLFPFLISAIIATFQFPVGIGYIIISIANTIFWYAAYITKLQLRL